MFLHTKHGPLWLFSNIGMWRSWTAKPKVLIWTLLSISGIKWPSRFVIWITLLQHSCVVQWWLPGMPLGPGHLGACCSRRLWRAHMIWIYDKFSQRPSQPSHQKWRWSNDNFLILWLFLFGMRWKLTHLLPGRQSGFVCENLHSNVFFHILLIVDNNYNTCQNDPTTIYFAINNGTTSNSVLNAKKFWNENIPFNWPLVYVSLHR